MWQSIGKDGLWIYVDEGIQRLANLTSLDLFNNNKITNEGIQRLTNLTSLNLRDNKTITEGALLHFKDLIIIK